MSVIVFLKILLITYQAERGAADKKTMERKNRNSGSTVTVLDPHPLYSREQGGIAVLDPHPLYSREQGRIAVLDPHPCTAGNKDE